MNARYLNLMRDKIALQNIIMMRTCPPDRELFSKSNQAQKHVLNCLMCQERLGDNPDLNIETVTYAKPSFPMKDPLPGQIWTITPELAGWGADKRYYNPPRVLLLRKVDKMAFEVAQISFDDSFYSADDIMIQDMNVFAQPWNTYTMALRHLVTCLSEPSPDTLIEIIEKSNHNFRCPSPDSFLYIFRQVEVETGSFFARKSIYWLMQHQYATDQNISIHEIKRILKQKYPTGQLPDNVNDPFLFMAKFRLPEHLLVRAASDIGDMSYNHVVFRGDDFKLFSSMAHITRQDLRPDGMQIFGQMKTDIHNMEVHAWWENRNQIINPDELEFEEKSPFFRIFFMHPDQNVFEKGTLILLTTSYE